MYQTIQTSTTVPSTESKGSFIFIAIRLSILFIVLCGIIYPLVTTGIAQLIMPGNANGSVIKSSNGQILGSELIGQNFTDPKLFHGRVSSIEYKAESSGSNNYAPLNPALLERVQTSINDWKLNNPSVPIDQLPVALITNSGSGLDPHITPESALVQIPRISSLTGLSEAQLKQLVSDYTEGRDLGLFGEKRVNVLKMNLALQDLEKK